MSSDDMMIGKRKSGGNCSVRLVLPHPLFLNPGITFQRFSAQIGGFVLNGYWILISEHDYSTLICLRSDSDFLLYSSLLPPPERSVVDLYY